MKVEYDVQYGNTSAGLAQKSMDKIHSPIFRYKENLCSVEMGMAR